MTAYRPDNPRNLVRQVQHEEEDDSWEDDYDEEFKKLLSPIEAISKINNTAKTHLDLIRELNSYLNYLKISSEVGGSTVFVEAATMIQNVNLIYQKKVDDIVDDTMKLVAKFKTYKTTGVYDEVEEEEIKKPKEKSGKFFSSFEPIEIITGPLKPFDCKHIDVSKMTPLTRFVLNTNIKVNNRYSQLERGIVNDAHEIVGKKTDFLMNGPVSRSVTVSQSTDCSTKWRVDDPESMAIRATFHYADINEPRVFNDTLRDYRDTLNTDKFNQGGQYGQKVDQDGQEVDQDGQEVGQDGQEVGQDDQEVGQDGQEVGQDGQEVGQDGQDDQEVGQDGQEVGQDGQEVGQDGQEVGQDGQEVDQDGQEVNQDGRDSQEVDQDGQEVGQDSQEVGQDGQDSQEVGHDGQDSLEVGQDSQEVGQDDQEVGQDGQDSQEVGQDGQDEVRVANAQGPPNVVNINRVEVFYDNNPWTRVLNDRNKKYSNKPIAFKRGLKITNDSDIDSDTDSDTDYTEDAMIPTYIPNEKEGILLQATSDVKPMDPTFDSIVRTTQKIYKSEIRKKNTAELDSIILKVVQIPQVVKDPEFLDDSDNNEEFDENFYSSEEDEMVERLDHDHDDNFFKYRKNEADMLRYEQDEKETAEDQAILRNRIQAWHECVRPILEEDEEQRNVFDVDVYGTLIINRFTHVGEQKSFDELFAGMEKEEVARYFLSILMLTNAGKLKMIKTTDGKTLVELLKKERTEDAQDINVGDQVDLE